MSFATLPGPLFAQVVQWLYPQETSWIRDPKSRYADSGGRSKYNAKAVLQCFSLLSKTLHAAVRQTLELYLYEAENWRRESYHPALALGCSRYVLDGRIAPLLGSSFRMVAAQLLLIDLRATAITAASVVAILQTCPLLEELDVRRCKAFSVLNLARRLKKTSLESLAVGRLQKIEICGTGKGASWVGYRQQLVFDESRKYCLDWYGENLGRASRSGGPAHGEEYMKRREKLGSREVLPAVRAIEAIVHSLQQPATSFCMHVNGCENCLVTFAHFLPHDGCDEEPYDGRTYGQHTCMVCGEARFLCRGCVGYNYHYCAEDKCKACVCVKCDGGRSVKAICDSGNSLLMDNLAEQGTTYFELAVCCFDDCEFPTDQKVVCRDRAACCGTQGAPDFCRVCGTWRCAWCSYITCPLSCCMCDERACAFPDCFEVTCCDYCCASFCATCGPMCDYDERCEISRRTSSSIPTDTTPQDWTTHVVNLCPECYLEVHTPSTEAQR